MPDYQHELQFGAFITPAVARASSVLELVRLAEVVGLDLVSFQDHPYQPGFLDTWTLLSFVAAQTSNLRLAPNVLNLPLRPPVVLARSVATLDILSGGRVELGLGAGAFWDGIAAVGGRRLTPGQSVDALAEAIKLIRAIWASDGQPIDHHGEHYQVIGARPGPAPAHSVEIWLGAYKPRMLALTGAAADGWLPSMGYADPGQLAAMNAAIDEAAIAAGRHPAQVRRLYNFNGQFGQGAGFLQGSSADWAAQLAELTLSQGMSTYILAADSAAALQQFATEVVPAVRALVDQQRDRAQRPIESGTTALQIDSASALTGPLAVVPTPPPAGRLSPELPWDESGRPRGPLPDPERRYSADEQASGRHLVDVHDALRGELERLRDLVEQVAAGAVGISAARSFINQMALRQNSWTLGAFCASYCRIVTGHHTLEDRSVFPHLKRSDPRLVPVITRLEEEHHVIAAVLDQVDRALVAVVSQPGGMDQLRQAIDLLTDTLLSHLSYEEQELVEPLARLGF